MTRAPITISPGARTIEAIETLSARKISELPVVDRDGKPIGMIDITDLIGLMPAEQPASADAVPLRKSA
jgi:arabinose-5-phosphate isomerase